MPAAITNKSSDLFNWLRARFEISEAVDAEGNPTTKPADMQTFTIKFTDDDGHYVNDVILSLQDDDESQNSLKVYYTKDMDSQSHPADTKFHKFLEDLKRWASSKMLGFDVRDVAAKHIKRDDIMKLQESHFSPMSGTVKTSVQTLEDTRIIVKHTDVINDEVRGARTRKIHRIYVENATGERFLMPFVSLRGARAMARHINQGGNPYDAHGQAISEMVAEAVALGRFVRRTRNQQFADATASGMVEAARTRLESVKRLLNSLNGERGYAKNLSQLTDSQEIEFNEQVKDHFVQTRYDNNLDESLPYVWRAYQMHNLAEMEQFEQWANGVVNEVGETPDRPQVAMVKKMLDPKAKTDEKGYDVIQSAKGTPVIQLAKDAPPEDVKKVVAMVGQPSRMPSGTAVSLVDKLKEIAEAPVKKEIILTGHGKTVTVPVPDNVGMSHLTDIMARVQKQHPGMEMKYYEDGVQVDETLGGDQADELIKDTMAPGQEMVGADHPHSTGTGDETVPEGRELGHDTVDADTAQEILDRHERGDYIGDLVDDYPELQRMMDDIVIDHHLHPDDDHEEIEAQLMDDLEDIVEKDRRMNEAEVEEGNKFTDERLAAIKAGKEHFTVGGKTYAVTGDTSDEEEQQGMKESLDRILKLSGQRQ